MGKERDHNTSPEEQYDFVMECMDASGLGKWPPQETPKSQAWWKDKKTGFNQPFLNEHSLDRTCKVVEICAPPYTGKSSLDIAQVTRMDGKPFSVQTNDEPYIGKYKGMLLLDLVQFTDPSGDESDILPQIFLPDEKKGWFVPVYLQSRKAIYWNNFFTNMNDTSTMHLLTHGTVETLAWYYALATQEEESAFKIPDELKPNILENFRFQVAKTFDNLTSEVDAVIMLGISQEEAQRRRKLEKKTHPGWLVDDPFFETLNAWRGHIAHNVLPRMNYAFGTGFTIMNGERSKKVVTKDIEDYIQYVVSAT